VLEQGLRAILSSFSFEALSCAGYFAGKAGVRKERLGHGFWLIQKTPLTLLHLVPCALSMSMSRMMNCPASGHFPNYSFLFFCLQLCDLAALRETLFLQTFVGVRDIFFIAEKFRWIK
jgi:hypothetical protein